MSNNIEKRKEKVKPTKLFSIIAVIYDDGTTAGYGVEYKDMGRLKNQKLIFPCRDECLSSIRSIIPSAIPPIEELVNLIYDDLKYTDSGNEKTASINIDIYSDGFITTDFGEYIKGARGPAKCWRLTPVDFIGTVKARLGNLSDYFKPLLNVSSASRELIMTKKKEDVLQDQDEDNDSENEDELEDNDQNDSEED